MDTLALHNKIDLLPPNLRQEASLFLDFLIEKSELYTISNNNITVYDKILEPDADFYRAITKDELLERIYIDIEKKYETRK